MTIPPRFLDEIRSRLALSDIIGKRVRVTRAGREFKACCPFHNEKSPSFTINDDKQFYHCFGCGAHGDVIGFVMRHDNLSFIDAVEALSAEAGLQMPKPDPEAVKKAERARDLYTLMEAATNWFMQQLYAPGNKNILDYLQNRGLHAEAMKSFRIGFAPADRQALRSYLKGEGYDDNAMLEAGLLKKSENSREPYVFFRERVIFPVADRRGQVVAFGGRALPEHMRVPDNSNFTPAKYINSSDTPLFDKGRMLYGESHARQAARDGLPILVTEGYMDVIACHQAGFRGAVAPMGTAMTEDQILRTWSMIVSDEKTPILCFDGDEAGRRAASRACERILPLLKPNQSVRFAFLPEGEDPDSLLKAGGAPSLQKILDAALSLFDFIWTTHTGGRNFDTPESRAGLSQNLQTQIKTIADRDIQIHYQQLVRDRISQSFFKPFGGQGGKNQKPGTPRPGLIKPRRPTSKQPGVYLITAIVNHPYAYGEVGEAFGQIETGSTRMDQLREAMISALEADPDLDREALHNHLNMCGFEQEMDDILNESVYVHAAFASPLADSASVAAKWLEFWRSLQGHDIQDEIRKGWKQAFHLSSEDEEEKLRAMLRMKTSDAG